MYKIKNSFFLILSTLVFLSCSKENLLSNCYNKDLYEKNKNNFCNMPCNNVTGCDGKFYCNECEANKVGIKIK